MIIHSNSNDKRIVDFLLGVLFISNIIDSIIRSFPDRGIITLFHYGMMVFAILYILYYKGRYQRNSLYLYSFIIIFYFGILSLFSSDKVLTINYMIKFALPLPFFAVGYSLFKDQETFKYFLERSSIFLLYFVIYIIVVSVFHIGPGIYKRTLVSTGYFGIQGLYIPTFLVIIFLFLNEIYTVRKRSWVVLLSVLTFAIQIIILKRTNILLLIIGVLLYFFYFIRGNFKRAVLILLIFVAVFYSVISTQWFESSYLSRYSRFSQDYSLEEEGRFMEYSFVWQQISKSWDRLFFGTKEVFNDWEVLTLEWRLGRDRQLHSSYAQLLWNGGLIGLLLFLMFRYSLYKKLIFYYSKSGYPHYLQKLSISLLILFLINDLSGGITYITYNAFMYVLFGALLRIGREEYFLKHYFNKRIIENKDIILNINIGTVV